MKILILYNVARQLKKGIETDLVCEQEITIIVPLVKRFLQKNGYSVQTMETDFNLWEKLKRKKKSVDIVLNLAEAFGGGNTNETLVPEMLEALEIPFTGASAHNMHLTLDKEKTKLVLAYYGVPIPKHQVFRHPEENLASGLMFPLIVKPIREEASIGIYRDSVVSSRKQLRVKVQTVLKNYRQPALVEEFIKGREISVGMIGNAFDFIIFPPLEFIFSEAQSPLEQIRSYEYKWGGKREQMTRASLPRKTVRKLEEYTRIAYKVTECRDYARMDYRLDDAGNIYLLEVNYNPGIGPNTHGLNNTLTMMASFVGISFEDLVEKIISIAHKRYQS
ncbi:MAG: ATP-grasp domain-containing protein [bacterium]|nr:ATP-grasp domain-containing protein [bacterium]